MSLLASLSLAQWVIAFGIIAVCGLLILVVLVQQASGGGLVGAFGGGGGGGAFGAKTGDLFTVITVALAAIFLLLAIAGNYIFQPVGDKVSAATVVSTSPDATIPAGDVVPDSAEVPATGNSTGTAGDAGASGSAPEGSGSASSDKPASDTPPGSP